MTTPLHQDKGPPENVKQAAVFTADDARVLQARTLDYMRAYATRLAASRADEAPDPAAVIHALKGQICMRPMDTTYRVAVAKVTGFEMSVVGSAPARHAFEEQLVCALYARYKEALPDAYLTIERSQDAPSSTNEANDTTTLFKLCLDVLLPNPEPSC
jgi:hypothetical protein